MADTYGERSYDVLTGLGGYVQKLPTRAHSTPLDARYPSCERTDATLFIYPGDLAPSKVTDLLCIAPTTTQQKGEVITNSLGRKRVVKLSGWFLSSEQYVASLDLRHHLNWLVEKLIPHHEALHSLQWRDGVEMRVNCIWWSVAGHGGPTLWPEQMAALAALNLECSFDVYFFGDE